MLDLWMVLQSGLADSFSTEKYDLFIDWQQDFQFMAS